MKGPGKGVSNNPAGKPRGAVNRTTRQLREMMISFIDANIELLQRDFDQLDAKDRLSFFEKVIRLVLPPPVNPESLTTEQMEDIIQYLEDKQREQKSAKKAH